MGVKLFLHLSVEMATDVDTKIWSVINIFDLATYIKCKHVVINDPYISACDSVVINAVIFLKKTP